MAVDATDTAVALCRALIAYWYGDTEKHTGEELYSIVTKVTRDWLGFTVDNARRTRMEMKVLEVLIKEFGAR